MLMLILAAIWAAVLLPPWLQNRRERRPNDSILSFRSQLATMQRAMPGAPRAFRPMPVIGMSRAEARRRRRDVLATLAGAALLTLVMAVTLGGPLVTLHLFVDVLLVAYVLALINAQQQAVQRAARVRRMPARPAASAEPAPLLLRRTGS